MTFCFLIDINPSMDLPLPLPSDNLNNMNTSPRFSALDIGKSGIEAFLGATAQIPNMPLILSVNGSDRNAIKSPLGYPLAKFEDDLKNLSTHSDENDFSYALSYNFSVYNKYRLKNGTDRFGHGLSPWLVDPFNVVMVTDNVGLQLNQSLSFLKSTKESQNRANLSEMIVEPYRWDQHLYLVVIDEEMSEETRTLLLSGELSTICRQSGGEVFRVSNMKSAQVLFRDLASNIFFHHPTVALKIQFNPTDESRSSYPQPHLLHMTVSGTGEWVVPECYYIDLGTETLKPRNAQPLLTLSSGYMNSPGVLNNDNSPTKFLQLAEHLNVRVDAYELSTSKVPATSALEKHPLRHLSISNYVKKNGYTREDKFFVSVIGSNRLELSTNAVSQPSLASNLSYPFAIVSQGKTAGSWKMSILPFNFTKLFPLLKFALEQSANAQSITWVSQWRQELNQYLSTVPQYCVQGILTLIQSNHPSLRSLVQAHSDHKLHRTPFRQILKAQEVASMDVLQMEKIAKESWPDPRFTPKDINTIASESTNDIVKLYNLPKTIYDVNPDQILDTWETMRSIVYGSYGLTVQGLSVTTVPLSVNIHRYSDKESIFKCVGGSNSNEKSIKEMSDYRPVLAHREALRDPLNLTPDADEDTFQGLMKRKFDINFGNRFKKSSKQKRDGKQSTNSSLDDVTGMDIEGISGFISTSISRDSGGSTTTNVNSVNTSLANAQLFFMDTPHPYVMESESTEGTDDNSRTYFGVDSDDSFESNPTSSSVSSTMEILNTEQSTLSVALESKPDKYVLSFSVTNSPASSLSSDKESDNFTDKELPSGWKQCFSSRHNRVYWFNSSTGQSVWEFPKS